MEATANPVPFACPWVRVLVRVLCLWREESWASSLKGSIYSDTRIFPQVFNVHLKWEEKKKTNLESIGKDVCFKQAWSCLEIGLGIVRKKISEETWSPRPPVRAGRSLEIM